MVLVGFAVKLLRVYQLLQKCRCWLRTRGAKLQLLAAGFGTTAIAMLLSRTPEHAINTTNAINTHTDTIAGRRQS